MYRVYYFRFYNNGGARTVVFPPFAKVWKTSLTTFAAAAIAKDNHSKTGGNHTNI